ncbi:MAG: Response regulator receiver sensor hybrid histidine kinase [Verrucomicrobiales bacterium]|nr:Response regulator receiver sensor hybrid histidine kinase [Verrucomicrobiales bacterium]
MNSQVSRPILVIDDNQTIHQDFRKILCPSSATAAALDDLDAAIFGESRERTNPLIFEIHSAYQGQEGLAMVESGLKNGLRYPVAFVDVRMPPGWDGVETVSRMWQVDPDIQIVICTAYSEYSWDDMVRKLGQSDNLLILKKPFDNIEVQQLASALAEKWQLLQQKKNQIELLELKVKERTRELEETAELLRRSQETILRQERLAVVGQLSAGVAHEFNNILTVIQGHTSLLLDTGDHDAPTIESLQHIADSSERAATLTKQMLAFSRKQLMRRQAHDLGETILRLESMLRRVLSENISLQCRMEQDLPCSWADPAMVEQIIMNLVVNARDAMPRGGNLTISASAVHMQPSDLVDESNVVGSADRRAGSFVCLTVTDTGHGMDAATMKRMFEPFFTTKDVGKGTGLGLATVYGIAQQHEGWIEAISAVNKGTTFKVHLPTMSAAGPSAKHSERPLHPPEKSQGQTI